MRIVDRICEKYRADYNLMFDFMMEPINLTYGAEVPGELRDKIQAGLDKMNVCSEPEGIPLLLASTPEGEYTLSRDGKLLFRFANKTARIEFVNYDVSEAIAWTIYAVAAKKDWLNGEEGMYISCRCFSARQQAAAARIKKSVKAQYESSVPEERVTKALEAILENIDFLWKSAPLFSARPISEDAYKAFLGKATEMRRQDIAEGLFGRKPFSEELDAYREKVKAEPSYQRQLGASKETLVNFVYELPILAVGYFFTELNDRIDKVETMTPEQIQRAMQEKVRFSLTPENLRKCFETVDAQYSAYIKSMLQQDFLRTVCEETQKAIGAELTSKQKAVRELGRDLGRFCFTEDIGFEQESDNRLLGWRRLAQLEDSDIFSRDISWDAGSLLSLQRTICDRYATKAWICTEKLKNQVTASQTTDQYNAVKTPLLDERCVWAIWADVRVK